MPMRTVGVTDHTAFTHQLSMPHSLSGNGGEDPEGCVSCRLLHEREQDRLSDSEPRERHEQAVHPHPHAPRWRHAVLKRAEEFLVDTHRLVVATCGLGRLLYETFSLH